LNEFLEHHIYTLHTTPSKSILKNFFQAVLVGYIFDENLV